MTAKYAPKLNDIEVLAQSRARHRAPTSPMSKHSITRSTPASDALNSGERRFVGQLANLLLVADTFISAFAERHASSASAGSRRFWIGVCLAAAMRLSQYRSLGSGEAGSWCGPRSATNRQAAVKVRMARGDRPSPESMAAADCAARHDAQCAARRRERLRYPVGPDLLLQAVRQAASAVSIASPVPQLRTHASSVALAACLGVRSIVPAWSRPGGSSAGKTEIRLCCLHALSMARTTWVELAGEACRSTRDKPPKSAKARSVTFPLLEPSVPGHNSILQPHPDELPRRPCGGRRHADLVRPGQVLQALLTPSAAPAPPGWRRPSRRCRPCACSAA